VSQSKTAIAYQDLKRDLLDGVHAPGAKLRIDHLCETYGVSPGAIREALSRLTSDGRRCLASFVSHKGNG